MTTKFFSESITSFDKEISIALLVSTSSTLLQNCGRLLQDVSNRIKLNNFFIIPLRLCLEERLMVNFLIYKKEFTRKQFLIELEFGLKKRDILLRFMMKKRPEYGSRITMIVLENVQKFFQYLNGCNTISNRVGHGIIISCISSDLSCT